MLTFSNAKESHLEATAHYPKHTLNYTLILHKTETNLDVHTWIITVPWLESCMHIPITSTSSSSCILRSLVKADKGQRKCLDELIH